MLFCWYASLNVFSKHVEGSWSRPCACTSQTSIPRNKTSTFIKLDVQSLHSFKFVIILTHTSIPEADVSTNVMLDVSYDTPYGNERICDDDG